MRLDGGTLERLADGVTEQVVTYTEPDDGPGFGAICWVIVEGDPGFVRPDDVVYRHGGEGGGEKRLWVMGVLGTGYVCGFGQHAPQHGGGRDQ